MLNLDVQVKPKESGTVVLNPSPIGKSGYAAGITVTIDVIPQPGWVVEDWIGPVFSIEGTTAHVEMDASKSVVVLLAQTEATGSESASPSTRLLPAPTYTPYPTATPRPTYTPKPTWTAFPPTAQPTSSANCSPAPDGAVVTAWVNREQVASDTVYGGSYFIIIDQEDYEFTGELVWFEVNGMAAPQEAKWVPGGADYLNLTVEKYIINILLPPSPLMPAIEGRLVPPQIFLGTAHICSSE